MHDHWIGVFCLNKLSSQHSNSSVPHSIFFLFSLFIIFFLAPGATHLTKEKWV